MNQAVPLEVSIITTIVRNANEIVNRFEGNLGKLHNAEFVEGMRIAAQLAEQIIDRDTPLGPQKTVERTYIDSSHKGLDQNIVIVFLEIYKYLDQYPECVKQCQHYIDFFGEHASHVLLVQAHLLIVENCIEMIK